MRVFQLLMVAIAMAAGLGNSARAADWYTGVPTDGPPQARRPRVAIDISLDATSQRAVSGVIIGTIAPFAPMDRSGMRVRASALAGTYVYTPSNAYNNAYYLNALDTLFYYGYNPFLTQVYGTIVGGSLLVGYEWVTNRATVAIYAGGEVMNTSLSPNDPNNSVKGGRGGFKIATDFYVTPTDDMMISGVASYSTNFNSYYGRLKFGFAIADRIYIGPEAGALGDNFFQQWRLGGHVSGLRFGMMQFGAAIGYLNDRVRGGGVYGTLDTRVTF